jgi:polysaccharide deacetylase family protein (PEP-CTERM system associated)
MGGRAEPQLVRAIVARGHELASHGYAHRLVYEQTPEAFREDVKRAKGLLEATSGRAVRGYRAPSFSVTEQSMWALDVLLDEGYRYDASIFPIRHDRYGIPDSPRWPHAIQRERGSSSRCRGLPCGSARPICRSPAAATFASCRTRGRAGASRT